MPGPAYASVRVHLGGMYTAYSFPTHVTVRNVSIVRKM